MREREHILSPHAAALSQSMRDLGYSLETAIADLIDNSITASSKNIHIYLELSTMQESHMVILDDGVGMTESELLEAMRPGSRNPRERREKDDLGRFGLGLKTASFSQCRSLTVVSCKSGKRVATQWDLDVINIRNEWVVTLLLDDEIEQLPHIDQLGRRGTYVLWRKLDRLLENNEREIDKNQAYEKLSVVQNHLALVFHRYLSGDYDKKRKLAIYINNHKIEEFDPFCTSNKATQLMSEEIVRIDGHEIRIQPYILPHHSKLSKKEYDFYNTRNNFVSNQGAYVYRNGRLMVWGDWFRIISKNEATKLARIQIDFTNALDEHWTIDIKKSRAHPPLAVREKLRQIINRITERSKRVHIGRGNRLFSQENFPLWLRFADRTGIRYAISRDHPLIRAIESTLHSEHKEAFEDILQIIERSMPIEAIYADYSSTPQSFEEKPEVTYDELRAKLQTFYMLMNSHEQISKDEFTRIIYGIKPFNEHRELVDKILEDLV